VFKIPKNVVGMFTVRSKYAQLGLEQSTSVFMHPGFDRKLILELKNFSERRQIPLVSGESVGQITFFRCSEELVKLE
jgi:deoxycytidine triphosphate deaminase